MEEGRAAAAWSGSRSAPPLSLFTEETAPPSTEPQERKPERPGNRVPQQALQLSIYNRQMFEDLFSRRLLNGKTLPRASETRYCRTRKKIPWTPPSSGSLDEETSGKPQGQKRLRGKAHRMKGDTRGKKDFRESTNSTPRWQHTVQIESRVGAIEAKCDKISGNIEKRWEHDKEQRCNLRIPDALKGKNRIGTKAKVKQNNLLTT